MSRHNNILDFSFRVRRRTIYLRKKYSETPIVVSRSSMRAQSLSTETFCPETSPMFRPVRGYSLVLLTRNIRLLNLRNSIYTIFRYCS